MGQELEATEFIQLLKGARVAIDEALANLGESVDDVAGFGRMPAMNFHMPMMPAELVGKMGSSFQPGAMAGDDGKCTNFICDAPGGGF